MGDNYRCAKRLRLKGKGHLLGRLQIDRRTVKAKIDESLLARLRPDARVGD